MKIRKLIDLLEDALKHDPESSIVLSLGVGKLDSYESKLSEIIEYENQPCDIDVEASEATQYNVILYPIRLPEIKHVCPAGYESCPKSPKNWADIMREEYEKEREERHKMR